MITEPSIIIHKNNAQKLDFISLSKLTSSIFDLAWVNFNTKSFSIFYCSAVFSRTRTTRMSKKSYGRSSASLSASWIIL